MGMGVLCERGDGEWRPPVTAGGGNRHDPCTRRICRAEPLLTLVPHRHSTGTSCSRLVIKCETEEQMRGCLEAGWLDEFAAISLQSRTDQAPLAFPALRFDSSIPLGILRVAQQRQPNAWTFFFGDRPGCEPLSAAARCYTASIYASVGGNNCNNHGSS